MRATQITLTADSPDWYAEAFMSGITMCFRNEPSKAPWIGPRIRIEALTFNGKVIFDLMVKPVGAGHSDDLAEYEPCECRIAPLHIIEARPVTPDPAIWGEPKEAVNG